MLESLDCRLCGGELQQKDDGTYVCSHCTRAFVKKTEDDYAASLKTLIDAEKFERVSAARQNLWRAMHEEYINSSSCLEYARELKSLIPSDYYANFAETANGKNDADLSKFLNESLGEDIGLYADAVLDFMLKSLTSGTLTAVSSYIDRAFDKSSAEYSRYIDLFEMEANKVDAGIYELSITRDVFIAYSSADMPKVLELCDFLEEQDITCFLAMRNLRHGKGAADNYDRALQTAMDNCRVVVFVSSKNSRKLGCDAMRKELPYMRKGDTDNAPAEYKKLSYDKLPARYKKDRVEYILDDYSGSVADTAVKQYFDGFEWCTSLDAVALRVVNYLSSVPDIETGTRSGGLGEEDLQKIVSAVSGDKGASLSIDEKEKNVLEHVKRLTSIGDFAEAGTRLADLEKDEISAKGVCTAAVYLYEILVENEVLSPEDLVKKYVDAKHTLSDDKYFKLARTCPDSLEKSRIIGLDEEIRFSIAEREKLAKEKLEKERNDRLLREQQETEERLKNRKAIEEKRNETGTQASDGLKIKVKSGRAVVLGIGSCKDTEICIPAEYNGAPVTEINDGAFAGCTGIKSVRIPYGVTEIESKAFMKCTSLEEVFIPDSVVSLGSNTFNGCSALREVVIPNAITKIENGLFAKCTSLVSVNIPKSSKSVHPGAFDGCPSCLDIYIDDVSHWCTLSNMMSIHAFNDIKEKRLYLNGMPLKNLVIPEDVKYVPYYAFAGCLTITDVTIPKTVVAVGAGAFMNCTNLVNVGIEEGGIGTLEERVFSGCTSLMNVNISSGVTVIERYAFQDCSSLGSITVPESVTDINEGAFIRCTSLASVTLPRTIDLIDKWVFSGCTSLLSISLPIDLKQIRQETFLNCSSLEDVFIPASTNVIGERAFGGCSSLKNVYYSGISSQWNSIKSSYIILQDFEAQSIENFRRTNGYLVNATRYYNCRGINC